LTRKRGNQGVGVTGIGVGVGVSGDRPGELLGRRPGVDPGSAGMPPTIGDGRALNGSSGPGNIAEFTIPLPPESATLPGPPDKATLPGPPDSPTRPAPPESPTPPAPPESPVDGRPPGSSADGGAPVSGGACAATIVTSPPSVSAAKVRVAFRVLVRIVDLLAAFPSADPRWPTYI
jgi:hypothetical protein